MVYQSKYSWRSGYTPKVSAEIVGNALERLKSESEEGTVNAEMFLEYSRPEQSETHALFEWRDHEAAEKWRLYQAGRIINQLDVTLIEVPSEETEIVLPHSDIENVKAPIKVNAFVNIQSKGPAKKGNYIDVMTAFRDEEMKQRVLKNALWELEAFQRKYERYTELSEVINAIDNFKGVMNVGTSKV